MKIRTLVWELCLAAGILLIGLGVYGTRQINQLSRTVNQGAAQEGAKHFQVLLSTERRAIESYVYDLTWWDDMVEFTQTRDTDFADDNIGEVLELYGLESATIFDHNFKPIYSARTGRSPELNQFGRHTKAIKTAFKSTRTVHFFATTAQGVIEFFGASIHPSHDDDRLTEPSGYMMVARPWNNELIDRIEQLSQSDLIFERPFLQPLGSDPAENNCHFRVPLLDEYDRPVSMLKINQNISFIRTHQILARKYLTLFLGLYALLGLGLLTGIYVWILRPLKRISQCLQQDSIAPIEGLTHYHELSEMKDAISTRLRQAVELEKAKADADRANKSKSQFLRNLSHEFKTPLNGVFGARQMLEMTDLSEEQREYIGIINECGSNLDQLINELLLLTRLENGSFESEEAPLHLNKIIDALTEFSANKAIENELKFESVRPDNTPVLLLGDASSAQKIVYQLLRNAFKFTHAGKVSLLTEVIRDDAQSLLLRFSVIDTGIGIAADQKEAIMDTFTQADESDTRRYAGLGLGLALASALTAKLNGDISFYSEEGKGSTFMVELPFRKISA